MNNLNIARFAQMTQKTNQFNLTTRRYTEIDLQNFAGKGSWIYGLRVRDRFGDNGLTGLIIVRMNNSIEAEIDTFLLSCRIIGKNIEEIFIQYILQKLKKVGIQLVRANYIQTLKNEQVAMFYERMGFQVDSSSAEKKSYSIDIGNFDYTIRNIYKLVENER
jgi:FkbH-like protein